MPRAKKISSFESTIGVVVAKAAAEIAAAVRASVASDLQRLIAGGGGPSAASPVAKRGPGRPRKAAPAPTGHKGGLASRTYSDADIEKILGIIKARPGVGSAEIYKAAGMDNKVVGKVLDRLRARQQVQMTGAGRATKYSAL